MKLILALTAVLLTAPAVAQTWDLIGRTEGGEMYFDTTSIQSQPPFTKAWLFTSFNKEQSDLSGGTPYRGLRQLFYFDCGARTYAAKQNVFSTETARNANPFSTRIVPDGSLSFVDPIPGTLGDEMVVRACGRKR